MSDIEFFKLLKDHLQLEHILNYPFVREDYLVLLNEVNQMIQKELKR